MNKPTDSVRIVIFDIKDTAKFLVLAEADDPTNWKLPGGKFDSVDEDPQAAAERELMEELKAAACDISLQAVDQLVNDDGESARYISAGRAYPEQLTPSDEIEAVRWVTDAEVPDSPNKGHILSAVALARASLAAA